MAKKEEVSSMFNRIAPKYDFLNKILSLRIDRLWRRRLCKIAKTLPHTNILDIATGTGDLAIALQKRLTNAQSLVGIDISEGMLKIAEEKIKQKKLEEKIKLMVGDSEQIPFADEHFELVTVAFGVRNFEHLELGLNDIRRVLKPGGHALILEFSQPKNRFINALYRFYSFKILPKIGRLFSKDKQAYNYLPETAAAFPSGEKFLEILKNAGFQNAKQVPLTCGIASIYYAQK